MRRVLLSMGAIVLTIACNWDKEDRLCKDGDQPVNIIMERSKTLYSEALTGMSCEEFNSRQTFEAPDWGSCITTFSPGELASTQTIYTNDPIDGILSGDTIAVDQSYIYSLVSRGVEITELESLEVKVHLPLPISPQKIFLYKDKIVVYGERTLYITNLLGELLFKEEMDGDQEISLKGEYLFLRSTKYIDELSDEEFCEKIIYANDARYSALTSVREFSLEELIYLSEEHYYGARFYHLDKKRQYLGFEVPSEKGERQTALMKKGSLELSLIEGVGVESLTMREYGEYLHLFSWDWKGGSSYYVLNSDLQVSSRIEGIAPGEFIGAARFTPDFSYIMTYLNVDPLFVFDLKDHSGPELIGELKFPGTPRFLHEVDTDTLISLGVGENNQLTLSVFSVENPAVPLRTDVLTLDENGIRFDYDYKNFIFHNENILIKGEYEYYLVWIKDHKIEKLQRIPIYGNPRTFFVDDELLLKDGREWESIKLND